MSDEAIPTITGLLRQVEAGDRLALDRICDMLYPDLKRLARARLHGQGRAGNMATTTLVHETFIRLVGAGELSLADRRHFFAYTAKIMRNIIIDEARFWQSERRGAGAEHTTLSGADADAAVTTGSSDMLRLHDALVTLEALDLELAQIVELRYFGGYDDAEIAGQLAIGERTVRRRWDKARAWLLVELGDDDAAESLRQFD